MTLWKSSYCIQTKMEIGLKITIGGIPYALLTRAEKPVKRGNDIMKPRQKDLFLTAFIVFVNDEYCLPYKC